MAKARMYGKATAYTPNKRRDLRYIKKTARNRERAMPSLVAGATVKHNTAKDINPPPLPTREEPTGRHIYGEKPKE